ncbi:Cell wall-binding protein YocH precursor [Jeotgalicoccus saudimassiliensis]|uniref:Cell wall-binding protein YocH n=1 Tax=Jeotgalicoccus saudimassiliensis TaxID=1461582 RepID=A0A078MF61_9STAP|nr:LysM peptidoglycan-binding domain-containing protein [Jeotgalicoccus saudimassiliensis]CEA03341.1 Cell wall-binding protein YocH precursor [Jeotgalicoccus saudimassiliensis]
MKKVLALGAAVAVSTTIAYSAEAASHTVESGDSLWALAEENNVTVESIKKENKLTSDIIIPGQILEIGEKEEKEEVKENKEDKEDKKEKTEVYTIEAGDTLFEIAVEFDVTVADLKEWNNLSSDLIFAGKELIVSGDAVKAAAPVAEAPAVETETETAAAPVQEETYEEPAQAPVQQEPVQQEPVQQPAQQPVQQPAQQTQNVSTNSSNNSGLNWGALAACESGGNPSVVSSNGLYHGLYQFDAQTWQSVGGSGVASNASAAEQTKRAQILYNQRGSQPWPVCGARL